jgi:hypothetical protein
MGLSSHLIVAPLLSSLPRPVGLSVWDCGSGPAPVSVWGSELQPGRQGMSPRHHMKHPLTSPPGQGRWRCVQRRCVCPSCDCVCTVVVYVRECVYCMLVDIQYVWEFVCLGASGNESCLGMQSGKPGWEKPLFQLLSRRSMFFVMNLVLVRTLQSGR